MKVWKLSSTALAASCTSPMRAPSAVNQAKAGTRQRVRTKMSPLTRSMRSRRGAPHKRAPAAAPSATRRPAQGGQAEQRGAPLGDQGRERDTLDAPAEPEHEPQVEHDVDGVGEDGDRQRRAHALHAEQPADDDVLDERGGRAPDSDREIGA